MLEIGKMLNNIKDSYIILFIIDRFYVRILFKLINSKLCIVLYLDYNEFISYFFKFIMIFKIFFLYEVVI